jgi:hypothetical protein
MKNQTFRLGGICVCLLGLAGLLLVSCSKSNSALEASGTKAFQTADAPTKAIWNAVVAALKTNGYAPALTGLQTLASQPSLTPEQNQATAALAASLNDQLINAASKGDAQAIEALKQLRSSFRR